MSTRQKHIELMAVMCVLTILLLVGCEKIGSSPKEVLSKYLDASLNGRYEEAYQYVSAKDKAIKSLQEYLSENSKEEGLFARALASKISYKIKEVTITGNNAKASVEVTTPDFGVIFEDILGVAFKSAFGEKKDEKEIEKMLAEKYKGKEIPVTNTTQLFDLINGPEGWKVFFDWETKKKINEAMSQAKQLEKEKKIYAAKDKYQEVLELNSKMVEATEKIEELNKEIKSFKEKQAYIKNVVLYDLKAKYYKTYLEDRLPGVKFKLKNKGNRTLKKVEVTIYFKDANGIIITEKTYCPVLVTEYSFGSDNKPLKPNYIWQLEREKFYKADSVPSEWKEGAVSAKITNIEFAE